MFDFEKLEVYQKAKLFHSEVYKFIKNEASLNRTTRDQLSRASLSIMLNIAEGSSRFSKADRKNYFVIARGSVFECVAILDYLFFEKVIQQDWYKNLYAEGEELSKMLFVMIKNLQQ